MLWRGRGGIGVTTPNRGMTWGNETNNSSSSTINNNNKKAAEEEIVVVVIIIYNNNGKRNNRSRRADTMCDVHVGTTESSITS